MATSARDRVREGIPEIGADGSASDKRTLQLFDDNIDLENMGLEVNLEDYGDFYWWEEPNATALDRIWDEREYEEILKEFGKEGVHNLVRDQVTHIRQPSQVTTFGDKMLRQLDQMPAQQNSVIVGMDTEGGNATCQLSTNERGEELNHVYQLVSKKGSHCLEKGQYPKQLEDVLTHPNATFAGKGVRGDIIAVMGILKIEPKAYAAVNYIEALTVFNFCYMLSYPEELSGWIRFPCLVSPLHDVSLRTIHNFALPHKKMDKRGKLRNHKSDYEEKKRHIKREEFVYCAGDAKAGHELIIAIAELLQIPPELLAQEVGGPIRMKRKERVATEFVTTHGNIVKIVDAYVTGAR
jgi:hypothetical protein